MTTAGSADRNSSSPIELEDVGKRYFGQRILEHASLAVRPGEQLAVMGRSGSGKSTLLRLIGGLEPPDTGSVRLAGQELARLSEHARAGLRRRLLGFVFQFFNLITTLTVTENVELPLALLGVAKNEARRRSRELLRELGVADSATRFPEELSGGEQQRAAIARALVHEPAVVLADEPTGSLDFETAQQVLKLLSGTCRQRGATLVVATHSREIAAAADRIVEIRAGRIAETQP